MLPEPVKPGGFGLYLHIPFCDRICIYCDFCVTTRRKLIPDYIGAMLTEMALYSIHNVFQNPDTIYFGGGTPSVLSATDLIRILDQIRIRYAVHPETEITVEANPNHLDYDKTRQITESGINRISIGAQSFIGRELRFLTRTHNADSLNKSLDLVRLCGCKNINIDLIFGLPGQTLRDWLFNLESALNFNPEHFSVYNLTVERDTYLDRFVKKNNPVFPDDDIQLEMFLAAHDLLTSKGYRHYEISNYAKPGFESKHNQAYWSGKPYLGLGTGSHSFDGSMRFWNTKRIESYIGRIRDKNEPPVEGTEVLGKNELMEEKILLGLRTDAGFSVSGLESLSGLSFANTFSETIGTFHNCLIADNDRIRLTPAGYFLYNRICGAFINALPVSR